MPSLAGFPDFFIGHFFTPKPCEGCKKLPSNISVGHPDMRMEGDLVRIIYRGACPCGRAQPIIIKMHVALYGYVVARFMILNSDKRARRSQTRATISPGPCSLMATFAADFARVMARYKEMLPSGVSLTDQFVMPMSAEEFSDFLRRSGLQEMEGEHP